MTNFRGFDAFDLAVDGQSLFLIGENAGGKTSLLTALARALGRDRSFAYADFRDPNAPIEITATLDDLDAAQRGALGDHAEFATGQPARVRVQARAVWDASSEEVESEHLFLKDGKRSKRDERDAIPLLWLSAARDAARILQLGVPRNVMGQLLDQLPLDQSIDQAVSDIQDASDQFAQNPDLQQFLAESRDDLSGLLPGVAQDAYALGLAAATGRDLLRQFELLVKYQGEPVSIAHQSSGVAQLSVFVFALKLATAAPDSILLIDEPEISLHPQAQRAIVQKLRNLQAQTLIATHSSNLLERGDPRRVARVSSATGTVELAFPATLSDDEAAKLARFTNPHAAEAFFARAIILVEGESDRLALEVLAQKQGRDLDAEGITIVPINGAPKAPTYIALFGPRGFAIRLAGLYDDAEEKFFLDGLARAGVAPANATRPQLEGLGFYACVADLEAELVRALGAPAVDSIIRQTGDGAALQNLQGQSMWQGQTLEEQILGFLKSRKVQYAPLMTDALPPGAAPSPLAGVLSAI